MALSELEPILNKDAIIATYPVQFLRDNASVVEEVYRTHARTHIPLGDTSRYVGRIFKWVGGGNKGAFVGGVVGEHGHGKTSFQVHVWDEGTRRGILAVPPFSWDRISDIIDGAAAWVSYVLARHDQAAAREAQLLYDEYREKSLQEVAERVAKKKGTPFEEVLVALRDIREHGGATVETSISPEDVLNYFQDVTSIVQKAGFNGFLVLLDEPEVAARRLGHNHVSQILFDLSNGLLQRQGDFGLFISLPERFVASAVKLFPALTARLQDRNCLVRLRNIYGPDFAQVLWERFVSEFRLTDEEKGILTSESLRAIGQVASSERSDLSYGPRTVISAFRRAVRRYVDEGIGYSPYQFVEDCLKSEVLVSPDYPTRVQKIMASASEHGVDGDSIQMMAAFPNGIPMTEAFTMGISDDQIEAARRCGLVYKRANLIGLAELQMRSGKGGDSDELRDAIEEIFGEFAPRLEVFTHARDAFIKYVIPKIFQERKGQQLLGWSGPPQWDQLPGDVKIGEFEGAFRETEKDYPHRRVLVLVGPMDYTVPMSGSSEGETDLIPDVTFQLCLRWSEEIPLPERRVSISPGDPVQRTPAVVRIILDLTGDPMDSVPSMVEEVASKELLTPLGILNLLDELDRRSISKEFQLTWEAAREPLVREVMSRLFNDPSIRTEAEQLLKAQIPSGPQGLFGAIALWVLQNRYRGYSTLMRQPHWSEKVDSYIRALGLERIPTSAKRGHEPWIAATKDVALAFGSNAMNLSDALSGYSNLVVVKKMGGRDGETEVTFRLHPAEQEVRDMIMSAQQTQRLKVPTGETSWWLDTEEAIESLGHHGYNSAEIEKIMDIGVERGTFYRGQHRGRDVLYCLPLDIDQMKAQLRERFFALKHECEILEGIPGYTSSFDSETLLTQIEALKDEGQFEILSNRITREFDKNHSSLPTYFDQLTEQLRQISRDAQRIKQELCDSRQVAGLDSLPTGTSKWSADLSEFVVHNLKVAALDIRKKCTDISAAVEKTLGKLTRSQAGQPMERINTLHEEWTALQTWREQLKTVERLASDLKAKLDDYDSWRKLLNQSDVVYHDFLQLKQEPEHAPTATKLIGELESIWNDISHHLQTRSIAGLGSHRQFAERIAQLEEARRTYLQEQRQAFDKQKKVLNDLLAALGVAEDARCTEQYNPMDPSGSSSRLLLQATTHVRDAICQEHHDLTTQEREVLYTRDILKWVSAEQAAPFLSQINQVRRALAKVDNEIDDGWLTRRLTADDGEPHSDLILLRDSLERARQICRSVRQLIRTSRPAESAVLSSSAQELLELLPPDDVVNLKQLILSMMSSGRDSREVLDVALSGLSELFRQDKVQIKVELPRR